MYCAGRIVLVLMSVLRKGGFEEAVYYTCVDEAPQKGDVGKGLRDFSEGGRVVDVSCDGNV